jgi:sec-independent protein translocase protein TatC
MNESIAYLIELRQRLLHYFLVLGVVFIVLALFANHVYRVLTLPLLHHIANSPALIAISVPAPFLVPLKSALLVSFFITMPYLLYQLWCFIVPGLYRQERKLLWGLLFSSVVLFYLGVAFAYVIVLPLVFQFFIAIAPAGVEVRPDMAHYFSFIVRVFLAFGFSFELPILIILLDRMGIYSVERLADKRPYVIIAAFVVGMLLTPPDVVSQILLAVPLWLLFELGVFFAKRRHRALESV